MEKESEKESEKEVGSLINELTYLRYLMNKGAIRECFRKMSIPEYIAMHNIADNSETAAIYEGRTYLTELSEKMKYNNNRIVFEIEMIRLCKPQMNTDYSALHHRIQQLENIVEQLLAGNTNIKMQKSCINESEFTTFIIRPQKKIYTEMYYS